MTAPSTLNWQCREQNARIYTTSRARPWSASTREFDSTHAFVADISELIVPDFDEDGDVDGSDFLVWQRGESPNQLSQLDLEVWQQNFGWNSSCQTSTKTVTSTD